MGPAEESIRDNSDGALPHGRIDALADIVMLEQRSSADIVLLRIPPDPGAADTCPVWLLVFRSDPYKVLVDRVFRPDVFCHEGAWGKPSWHLVR